MTRPPPPAGADASHLVEAYFERWLRSSDIGRRHVARFGFDRAMEHLWENLNAGLIKLEGNERGFTDIVPCIPPQRPLKPMTRPLARGHGNA
jgi:hypothetical protein